MTSEEMERLLIVLMMVFGLVTVLTGLAWQHKHRPHVYSAPKDLGYGVLGIGCLVFGVAGVVIMVSMPWRPSAMPLTLWLAVSAALLSHRAQQYRALSDEQLAQEAHGGCSAPKDPDCPAHRLVITRDRVWGYRLWNGDAPVRWNEGMQEFACRVSGYLNHELSNPTAVRLLGGQLSDGRAASLYVKVVNPEAMGIKAPPAMPKVPTERVQGILGPDQDQGIHGAGDGVQQRLVPLEELVPVPRTAEATYYAFRAGNGLWGVKDGVGGILYDADMQQVTADAFVRLENSLHPPVDWEDTEAQLKARGIPV